MERRQRGGHREKDRGGGQREGQTGIQRETERGDTLPFVLVSPLVSPRSHNLSRSVSLTQSHGLPCPLSLSLDPSPLTLVFSPTTKGDVDVDTGSSLFENCRFIDSFSESDGGSFHIDVVRGKGGRRGRVGEYSLPLVCA